MSTFIFVYLLYATYILKNIYTYLYYYICNILLSNLSTYIINAIIIFLYCERCTFCPRRSYPFYIVIYHIKWVTTSWLIIVANKFMIFTVINIDRMRFRIQKISQCGSGSKTKITKFIGYYIAKKSRRNKYFQICILTLEISYFFQFQT